MYSKKIAMKSKPITFECSHFFHCPARKISDAILDLDRWSEFRGYGIVPGIKGAKYEIQTENIIGSRIRVYNTDGSSHLEEILLWISDQEIRMIIQELTPPLSQFATHLVEEWCYSAQGEITYVKRRFQLFPRRPLTRPILWLISMFLRQAVTHHLNQMTTSP